MKFGVWSQASSQSSGSPVAQSIDPDIQWEAPIAKVQGHQGNLKQELISEWHNGLEYVHSKSENHASKDNERLESCKTSRENQIPTIYPSKHLMSCLSGMHAAGHCESSGKYRMDNIGSFSQYGFPESTWTVKEKKNPRTVSTKPMETNKWRSISETQASWGSFWSTCSDAFLRALGYTSAVVPSHFSVFPT